MLNAGAAALGARVAERLAAFPGFLRANGFAVGGGDAAQVLQTLSALVKTRDDRHALTRETVARLAAAC